jgi:hypothetical protein
VDHPNLNTYTEQNWAKSPYREWTEMKFFNAKQVQEVISTEYPDNQWSINTDGVKFMKQDIISAVHGKTNYSVGFQFSY